MYDQPMKGDKMKIFLIIILSVFLIMCTGKARNFIIIDLYQEESANDGKIAKNWITVFEVNGGKTRIIKQGKWGKIGDTMYFHRKSGSWLSCFSDGSSE